MSVQTTASFLGRAGDVSLPVSAVASKNWKHAKSRVVDLYRNALRSAAEIKRVYSLGESVATIRHSTRAIFDANRYNITDLETMDHYIYKGKVDLSEIISVFKSSNHIQELIHSNTPKLSSKTKLKRVGHMFNELKASTATYEEAANKFTDEAFTKGSELSNLLNDINQFCENRTLEFFKDIPHLFEPFDPLKTTDEEDQKDTKKSDKDTREVKIMSL